MNSALKHQIRHSFNFQGGFTLVELILTLAIAAVIMTQAIPSFSSMITNNRMVTQTNDLVADINLARSEAVARGVRVILCRSSNSTAAGATCSGTTRTWSTGWLMYADDNGSGAFETANDTLIRIGQPAHPTIAIMANTAGDTDLQFNSNGTSNEAGNTVIFGICDGSGVSTGRQISVNGVGRPRLISPPLVAGACTP